MSLLGKSLAKTVMLACIAVMSLGVGSASATNVKYFDGTFGPNGSTETGSFTYRTFNKIYGTTQSPYSWMVRLYTSGGFNVAFDSGSTLPVQINYSGPYNTKAHCGRWDGNSGYTSNTCWTSQP